MKSERSGATMQPMLDSEQTKAYRSEEQRLDAIARTLQETKESNDLDLRKLVSNAVDQYWRDRERCVAAELGDLEKETVQATAKFLDLTFDRRREFVGDLLAAILPSLVLVGFYWLTLEFLAVRVLAHPRRAAIELAMVCIFASGAVVSVLTRKMKNTIASSEFVKHNLGALAAGALMALAFLAGVSSAVKDSRESSVSNLQAMAMSSLQQKHQTGGFLQVAYASDRHTEAVTEGRAIYKIRLPEAPVDLVADIYPAGGELFLKSKGEQHVLVNFLVGRVESVSGNAFILRTANGETREIRIGEQTVQPVEHTTIAVSIDPNTGIARALAPIVPLAGDKAPLER